MRGAAKGSSSIYGGGSDISVEKRPSGGLPKLFNLDRNNPMYRLMWEAADYSEEEAACLAINVKREPWGKAEACLRLFFTYGKLFAADWTGTPPRNINIEVENLLTVPSVLDRLKWSTSPKIDQRMVKHLLATENPLESLRTDGVDARFVDQNELASMELSAVIDLLTFAFSLQENEFTSSWRHNLRPPLTAAWTFLISPDVAYDYVNSELVRRYTLSKTLNLSLDMIFSRCSVNLSNEALESLTDYSWNPSSDIDYLVTSALYSNHNMYETKTILANIYASSSGFSLGEFCDYLLGDGSERLVLASIETGQRIPLPKMIEQPPVPIPESDPADFEEMSDFVEDDVSDATDVETSDGPPEEFFEETQIVQTLPEPPESSEAPEPAEEPQPEEEEEMLNLSPALNGIMDKTRTLVEKASTIEGEITNTEELLKSKKDEIKSASERLERLNKEADGISEELEAKKSEKESLDLQIAKIGELLGQED